MNHPFPSRRSSDLAQMIAQHHDAEKRRLDRLGFRVGRAHREVAIGEKRDEQHRSPYLCDAADGGIGEEGAVRCGHRRSEEHTSELQSLMRISYAVFCLNKKKQQTNTQPDAT